MPPTFLARGSVQLRAIAPRFAPFINSFWESKEVLDMVSRLARVELVPVIDHEICHTSIQLGKSSIEEAKKKPVTPPEATDEAIKELQEWNEAQKREAPTEPDNPDKTVVPWHRDSRPFICVVIPSDTRKMVGGETELMKGDGPTIKARSPLFASPIR